MPVSDLATLLSQMRPELHSGRYAYVTLAPGYSLDQSCIVASIREPEGLSVIITEDDAIALGLPVAFMAAWITLTVHSDLAAVGLTAAFSTALGQAGISCNVVAGVHHDHLFVPVGQEQEAMKVLNALQQAAL